MYDEYLCQLEEAGKIRNLKDRSISCYKNYVSYFLSYVKKDPAELTCQDVRDFLLTKKNEGLKATTLNLYNSAIRFFYLLLSKCPAYPLGRYHCPTDDH